MDTRYQYILVGGGLQNGLLAMALLARQPGARLALVEKAPALGGNHTWCFHVDDVPEAAREIVAPLVAHRWPGYEVRFPGLARSLDTAYAAVTSQALDRVVRGRVAEAPGCEVFLDSEAIEVGGREVVLGNGRVLAGDLVIDARGPERAGVDIACTGYQKFLGLEVRVRGRHGLDRPMLMDATVPQTDGFHFFYTLPLDGDGDGDRLLIEDTYFSDTPDLDRDASHREIRAYAAAHGYSIAEVIREESGVLPLPWQPPDAPDERDAGDDPARGPLRAGYQGGWFHPVTGYSFPMAVRLAEYVAGTPIGEVFGPGLARLLREHRKQVQYGCRLNKMLFQWFPPEQRYNVLERFYRLPEPTIRRFYALTLTGGDRARILMGRPPRGMSLRAAVFGRRAP
ncbi:MAG TPA: lycopene beta-cyclase CrtY [Haliangium sp.]|nr:lycopene beta-cyclase CrtY [Haliangium sp.]